MITLNDFFDRIVLINLKRRKDRFEEAMAQAYKFDYNIQTFEGHDRPVDFNNHASGNLGCTASHRGVLELIAHNKWDRTLILEDDAMIVSDDFNEQFDAVVQELPNEWDFLFLGASYAEPPKRRVSGSLIQTNGLMTTSSYGITYKMARKMAPFIGGDVGIDSLYQEWQRRYVCLICSPRLMVQRTSFSDIQDRVCENASSMQDSRHEEMLLDGEWLVGVPGEPRPFLGQLNRRELSEASQLIGELAIIGGEQFTVTRVELPKHRMPWFAGEPVTYWLVPLQT